MPKPLRAFHGDPKIKAKYIARVRAHREADHLVSGSWWTNFGRGQIEACAVGCTIAEDVRDRQVSTRLFFAYEKRLGIPRELAYLEDRLFESMCLGRTFGGRPRGRVRMWPERFLEAIPVGADLSAVAHQFHAHYGTLSAGVHFNRQVRGISAAKRAAYLLRLLRAAPVPEDSRA